VAALAAEEAEEMARAQFGLEGEENA
jgi:hypothetical protein